jgi:hypothetical protein
MNKLQFPFSSKPPLPKRPQFNLRNLLYFTTGLCALFAILGALGVSARHALIGFAFVTSIVLVQAALVELFQRR